ncbi:hypothetical protein [Roseomonas indoligenes]|uniref:Uncharacterized protein n=1 Tax=Roseomonas indoligenes TaxID=2820811 RepID=A0A940N3J4_9PROT|nr:hypothetical protein [Pararoseomonas indoligenes]MBP0494525.1 hypothetical protein [Pararoseomonas indoligenes]
MWLAENWELLGDFLRVETGLNHPQAIRAAYNASLNPTPDPEEGDEEPTPAPIPVAQIIAATEAANPPTFTEIPPWKTDETETEAALVPAPLLPAVIRHTPGEPQLGTA